MSTLSSILKRRLAHHLQNSGLLRWTLMLGMKLLVPRHRVGTAGVVFNDAGHVLLAEHVFRPRYPWGLPGGWIKRGEQPADALRRELQEELSLCVDVRRVVLCEPHGKAHAVRGLTLFYYCNSKCDRGDESKNQSALPQTAREYEILSYEWVDPKQIVRELTPTDLEAIALGKELFERECKVVAGDP